jgi:hypothetical protein
VSTKQTRQGLVDVPGESITLGDETYLVVPQRHTRLTRRLFSDGGVFASIQDLTTLNTEEGLDSIIGALGGKIYEVLEVFIPDLMPRWQFEGYASEQFAADGQYDEEADRAPTVPEIKNALVVAIRVNGLDWIGQLKQLVDPRVLKNQISLTMARMGSAARESRGLGEPSLSSLPQNGASEPTSSGTTEPTPEPQPASAGPSD